MHIAGVDEAGKGPLAGPVVAAAVILNSADKIAGLADSKVLTAKKRSMLAIQIKQRALAWSVAEVTAAEIDQLNIFHAGLLAMQQALLALTITPDRALIDGKFIPPDLPFFCEAIVKGDARFPAISAASILAKVCRDQKMVQFDREYPCYGFAQHKGYPTRQHITALHIHGPSLIHRKSFAPVRACLKDATQP